VFFELIVHVVNFSLGQVGNHVCCPNLAMRVGIAAPINGAFVLEYLNLLNVFLFPQFCKLIHP